MTTTSSVPYEKIILDCERCELNAATARLVRERDAALAWAALWKRAATINRHDRAWGYWHNLRSWCANLNPTPLRRSLLRALGL